MGGTKGGWSAFSSPPPNLPHQGGGTRFSLRSPRPLL